MLKPLFFDEDVGATLAFTILTPSGDAYNLTGGDVFLLVDRLGEFICTITDAVLGLAEKVVAADEFPAGVYRAQIRTEIGGVILHSNVFNIQVSAAIDTDGLQAVVPPPVGNPLEGAIPFGIIGGGNFTTDASNLLWDDTSNILKLFSGTPGSSFAKGIVMGFGTAPGSSPTDSVALWANDINGAGTGSLFLRTEVAGGLGLRDGVNTLNLLLGNPSIIAAGQALAFSSAGVTAAKIPAGTANFGVYNNLLVGDPDAVAGDGGTNILVHSIGTGPVTTPVDMTQEWVTDIEGAGTASKAFMNETGHVHIIGRTLRVPLGSASNIWAAAAGTFATNVTNVGTPNNTTETILHSLVVPANTFMVNGQRVKFTFHGTLAANANNKTVSLYVQGLAGTEIVNSGTVGTNNADWKIEGSIIRLDGSNALFEARYWHGPAGGNIGAIPVDRYNAITLAVTFSSSFTIDLAGDNGSASANDIRCLASFLEFYTI